LQCEIREGNRIELHSTFLAGEGRGEISTSADYLQGRQAGFELAFDGRNMTLIDVPDLTVIVDTALRVGLLNDDVTISGSIFVPEARLSSVNVTTTPVVESSDVEFVGAQLPADEVQGPASDLKFNGSVDLELGERVTIDVNVAEARVRGKSTLTWRGPPLPRAKGLYQVSGKFEAYGQLLEITEGDIRYPGVPVDRPELRVRAEREIFGNSQVRRAGVLVTGTAVRPLVEVYTSPATSEDRALTLLATGSDFNYEQGVGAVDVGTYIAPRLYASYGIGLFDKENVISVRYDLASGFGIKATSGKRAAGFDISYTIEH
jgi:translocation and assembly module TamB